MVRSTWRAGARARRSTASPWWMKGDDHPNPFSVDGRVIVVTGAGRGIGAAISAALTRAGARVHGVDLHFDATDHLARATVCDVTDEGSLARLVSAVVEDRGRI